MSGARESILAAVRLGRRTEPAPSYVVPAWAGDTEARFIANARSAAADVHEIASFEDAPEAIWLLLSDERAMQRLHVPASSPLNGLPWSRAPGLTVTADAPSGSDSALSVADWAIAETGTLVFFSGERSPSSWHFRPGREIVLVRRSAIVPRLEDVIAILAEQGAMPATVNLVTGPSRTADIEQTIERGAHGPRDLHIFITA